MLVKLEAIVLHAFPYGDNSSIVKCFTNKFGLQSYLVNGVKNKKGVLKPAMVMPLTQLDLVAYHKNKGNLERIKEAKLWYKNSTIDKDPYKNALALFVAEVLLKVIKEEEANETLFQFVRAQLLLLDHKEVQLKDFHLRFLLILSSYLGFMPSVTQDNCRYFDMLEGQFSKSRPDHPYCIDPKETDLLVAILTEQDLGSTKETRMNLLGNLLTFYQLQIESFGALKSLEIIKVLF